MEPQQLNDDLCSARILEQTTLQKTNLFVKHQRGQLDCSSDSSEQSNVRQLQENNSKTTTSKPQQPQPQKISQHPQAQLQQPQKAQQSISTFSNISIQLTQHHLPIVTMSEQGQSGQQKEQRQQGQPLQQIQPTEQIQPTQQTQPTQPTQPTHSQKQSHPLSTPELTIQDSIFPSFGLSRVRSQKQLKDDFEQKQKILSSLNSNIDDLFKKISQLTQQAKSCNSQAVQIASVTSITKQQTEQKSKPKPKETRQPLQNQSAKNSLKTTEYVTCQSADQLLFKVAQLRRKLTQGTPPQLQPKNSIPVQQKSQQKSKHTPKQSDRQNQRQNGRQCQRQSDRQSDRQSQRQSDRQSPKQLQRQSSGSFLWLQHLPSSPTISLPKITSIPSHPLPPRPQPPKTGLSMRHFQTGNTLGCGKFGSVLQCLHLPTNTLYALKSILLSTIQTYSMHQQLLKELTILSRLSHPNIIKAYKSFTDDYHVFIVQEYIHGTTLVKKFGIKETEAKLIIKQVLQVVKYMGEMGVVHRDLKAENVMITKGGVVKVGDFGWGEILGQEHKETSKGLLLDNHGEKLTNETEKSDRQSNKFQQDRIIEPQTMTNTDKSLSQQTMNILCGTLDYICPEMAANLPYTSSVDLWSVGVLTYELICGVAPFHSATKQQTFQRVKSIYLKWPEDKGTTLCRQFVEGLLKKQADRMGVVQALNHKWFVYEDSNQQELKDVVKHDEDKEKQQMKRTEEDVVSNNHPQNEWQAEIQALLATD